MQYNYTLSVCIYAILFAFSSYTIFCCKYSTFSNVPARVTTKGNKPHIVLVNKCIENTEDKKDAFTIEISQQAIPILQQEAVVNLNKLRNLAIETSGIQRIQFKALSNLPVLTNLSLKSNELEEIEAEIFEGLTLYHLDLSNNKISYIENFALQINTLMDVYLSNNLLTSFQPEWFGESNLLHLELRNNFIEYLPANALVNLKKLRWLGLAKNKISAIHKNAFKDALGLRILILTCNRIKHLHEDLFASVNTQIATGGFRYLYLDGNNLTYIPKKVLDNLQRPLILLDVQHNPLECSCYWDIMNWGKRHRLRTLVDVQGKNPVCVTSLRTSSECREIVDEDVIEQFHKVSKPYGCPLKFD